MQTYCEEPYHVDRDYTINRAIVRDYEGNEVWNVPAYFTDEMIEEGMRLANRAYSIGYASGQEDKVNEIKAVLLI